MEEVVHYEYYEGKEKVIVHGYRASQEALINLAKAILRSEQS